MSYFRIWTAVLAIAVLACTNEKPSEPAGSRDSKAPSARASGHGARMELGKLTVAGREFEIAKFGELEQGKESGFSVHPKDGAELASLNAYLWVESKDGTQLSAPSKGIVEDGALHFHVLPRKGEKQPFRVVLRIRSAGTDDRSSLPLDGHGHEHPEGPHSGVPARFMGGGIEGHLELKLHDDKGDLELWLCEDAGYKRPFDLPLAATVEVELVDVGGRKVVLRARNREKNEDESGTPNVRDGKTNYFIFPSSPDEDASWLEGKEFQSIAIVRFKRGETQLVSEELVLRPHAH